MGTKTIRRLTAMVLMALAAGAPAAWARPADQGMPPGGWPDMHASTAIAAAEARKAQDLRSADARDAAQGRGTFSAPEVAVVKVPQTSPPASSGLDVSDAVIGAGGALTVILLASAGAFAVGHRRRGSVVPTA